MFSRQTALSASLCQAARNALINPDPNLVQKQPISPAEQDDSRTGGHPQPQDRAAGWSLPGQSERGAASSAPLQQHPAALPAWPHPCSFPRLPTQAGRGNVLNWLFTCPWLQGRAQVAADSFVCFYWDGGGGREEVRQELPKLFVFRQSKSTLCSWLLREQEDDAMPSEKDSDLLSRGTGRLQMSPMPEGRAQGTVTITLVHHSSDLKRCLYQLQGLRAAQD